MTNIYFVRHAQPDVHWEDDRTRPLTALGLADSKKVTKILLDKHIHHFWSSPYKRSYDTIADCANRLNMPIHTDERFRERRQGMNSQAYLERRWADFTFCEEGGECLSSVQKRNIEALNEVLTMHKDENVVIGTHGTALSSILNYFDPSFSCDDFKRFWFSLPYIIRIAFDDHALMTKTELLKIDRGYGV